MTDQALFPEHDEVPLPDHHTIRDQAIRQAGHEQRVLRARHRELYEQLHELRAYQGEPVWSKRNANEHDLAACELPRWPSTAAKHSVSCGRSRRSSPAVLASRRSIRTPCTTHQQTRKSERD